MSAIRSTTRTQAQAGSSGARAWLKKHQLSSYFILAYAITWLSLIGAIVAIQFDLIPSSSFAVETANQLGAFGPAIAAFVIASIVGGKRDFGKLLRQIVHWRVGFHWYLFVLVVVPMILVLGASVLHGPAVLSVLVNQGPDLLMRFLPLVATTVILTGLAEEPGWRGFALPRIQAKFGPLAGILILGVIWQLWHLPNMLMQPGGLVTFGFFTLATVVNGFVLAWVYNSTGSLLLVMLLHATQNSSSRLVSNLIYAVDPGALSDTARFYNELYLLSAVSFGLLVLLIAVLSKGRFGYKSGAQANPEQVHHEH